METPFQVKLIRVLQVVKHFLQKAPYELQAYAIENMGKDIGADAFRNGSGPLSLRNVPRNTTNQLNFRTNKLSNALEPKGAGNIFKISVENDKLQVEYGIDTHVVPYAAIHEYGGTINHPGGTPYKIVEGGRAVFVSKRDGADLKVTKPHTITIPKRPYLRPAYIEFSKKQIPRLLQRIKKELETE